MSLGVPQVTVLRKFADCSARSGELKRRPGIVLSRADKLEFRQAKLLEIMGRGPRRRELQVHRERFLKLCRGVYSHFWQRTECTWVRGNYPRLRKQPPDRSRHNNCWNSRGCEYQIREIS